MTVGGEWMAEERTIADVMANMWNFSHIGLVFCYPLT